MQSTFKYKPNKIKYLNNVNTLDNTHRKMLAEFEQAKIDQPIKLKKIEKFTAQLNALETKNKELLTPKDIQLRSQLKDDIKKLHHNLDDNEQKEIEYYSKVNDVIFDYYDIVERISGQNTESQQTQPNQQAPPQQQQLQQAQPNSQLDLLNKLSQQKRKEKRPTKKRQKCLTVKSNTTIPAPKISILDFFIPKPPDNPDNLTDKSADTDPRFKQVSNKASLYNEYMMLTDTSYNSGKKQKYNPLKTCDKCHIDKTLVHTEGIYLCIGCGEVEPVIIESEVPNYKDPVQEKPSYAYKRRNHCIEYQPTISCKLCSCY